MMKREEDEEKGEKEVVREVEGRRRVGMKRERLMEGGGRDIRKRDRRKRRWRPTCPRLHRHPWPDLPAVADETQEDHTAILHTM